MKFKDFLEFSAPDPGKLRRQRYSRPGRVNSPTAKVFPARKSFISDILGFAAGRVYRREFLCVYSNQPPNSNYKYDLSPIYSLTFFG
jgi:hypothetical protein